MDFKLKSRRRIEYKPEYEDLAQKYPHRVMIYRLPPTDDITLQEFEDLALERLKVLRVLEQARIRNHRLLSDEWKEYVNTEFLREGLKGYLKLCSGTNSSSGSNNSSGTPMQNAKQVAELQARRRDYISHFILRLAYCRSAELKRWFITHEMDLFKYKFSALSSNEMKKFLEINKLNYVPLTEEQKDEVKDGLYESTMGYSVAKIELMDFYKVPFITVLDLVRTRRCYLRGGFAYVNTNDFVSVVSLKFTNEIEEGLTASEKMIGEVESDERLFHLLKSLHTSYTGKDYAINKEGDVPIESLDQLSLKSYPLCMRNCHEHLRANHHLKHEGRMQYGLFLKGIGVGLENAIRFWREEFTKKIDDEKFNKGYLYNIQHNYGKKGSMVNYAPYSCLKLINDHANPGDANGCPYKLFDPVLLKQKLTANGLSAAHVQEVMSYASRGHFQLACSKYFQITHDTPEEVGVTHPNQYFEQSQILMGHRADKRNEKAASQMRRSVKRNIQDASQMNAADDDELWNIAETQESIYRSEKAVKTAFDDDLDLSELNY